jgi:GNAT superfamily N-acetyltransferase
MLELVHHEADPYEFAQFAITANYGTDDVGTVQYDVMADGIVVKHVEVVPTFRRQGIATQMYDLMRSKHYGAPLLRRGMSDFGRCFRNAYDMR